MAEGYESLPRLGRMRINHLGEEDWNFSPLTPRFIWGGPYYQALQLPCPTGLNLFVLLPHHHKIITCRNNFLLDAVQSKVNSCLADFEEAEGCRCSSALVLPSYSPSTSSCLARKSSADIGEWKCLQGVIVHCNPIYGPPKCCKCHSHRRDCH